MKIFQNDYSRIELEKKIGDISQLGGIKSYVINEGPGNGVRALDIKTPAGIDMTVLADRGLDISSFFYKSIPLCWKSLTKETSPMYYESRGFEFLRTFYGGFLLTCGLGNIGAPCKDNGEELGEHGRISNIAAENVCFDGEWVGDEYFLWVQGKLREARVAGDKLKLTRKITLNMSEPVVVLEDIVENIGPLASPVMILYHINLGFPVVDKNSRFLSSSTKVRALSDDSEPGLKNYRSHSDPIPEAKNEVFIHDLETDENGNANVAVINPQFNNGEGIGVWLKYNKNNLPYFLQWKSYQFGEYVEGIIPANSLIRGRDIERKEGTLKFIEPGGKINYRLEFKILESNKEIEKYRKVFS